MSNFLIAATVLAAAASANAAALPPALARLPYPQGHVLALQICLDRRRFSPNTFDGQYGRKTKTAFAAWCKSQGRSTPPDGDHAKFWQEYFPDETNLLCEATVAQGDFDALVAIPDAPAGKASLQSMGFATIQEAFASRGHLTENTLQRLNPNLAWPNPPVGSRVTLPSFPLPEIGASGRRPRPPQAAALEVSLSEFSVAALDSMGRTLALFPCSIAADKAKRPAAGLLKVTTLIPKPNYTYTPDGSTSAKGRFIFPPGPKNPVGLAWIGLSLPGYGIHGTPRPESIGRAESHGCFRLANWNAVLLLDMVQSGTPVFVKP